MTRTKRTILIASIVLFVVSALVFIKARQLYSKVYSSKGKVVKKEKQHIYSIVLLGYGGGVHEGTYLTDSIMVVRVDTKKKTAVLVSLPRDIWVRIPTKSGNSFSRKINAVYQMGLFQDNYPDVIFPAKGDSAAPALLKKVLKKVLGFPIDYYITIDFEGFEKAVDMLGGVTVNVQKPFEDFAYPIDGKEKDTCGKSEEDLIDIEFQLATMSPNLVFPCRYESLKFEAGEQLMDGKTALKFVRSRYSAQDGGDFSRAARQQLFVQAVKDKVLRVDFIPKIIPLMDDLSNYVRTDIALGEARVLLGELTKSDSYTLRNVVLSTDNVLQQATSKDGQYILIPKKGVEKWSGIHRFVNKIIIPSPTPKRINKKYEKGN